VAVHVPDLGGGGCGFNVPSENSLAAGLFEGGELILFGSHECHSSQAG
jgi:hypothetical protein